MISREEADRIAQEALLTTERESRLKLVLLAEATKETPFAWIYYWQSAEYVETGNIVFLLGGNSPILVDKADGAITFLPTARTLEENLHEYLLHRRK